ncbi:MAG TPA: 1-acyl-sn-glycerol-3-phosphate acyltransferase [Thermoanaerobaculia bacterium]|jgi:glycerol-3-phosphate O-acyltransferase|nr:1-acyl-sn-glycerol-3-phosphate acyltransferase [Thermoanaerobaculia bacterium]
MRGTVSLPAWLAVVLVLLAAWAALERLLLPGARWFVRRRVNRALEELNTRLRIRIPPFKLAKREVLIERLLWDPQVQAAAEAAARDEGSPRAIAMRQVERYAREIVPAFNAYAYYRFGYWIARNVARSLFRVRLGRSEEAELLAIPANATVVFLINHRSNMDYVLVSYLAAERAALSYAVGEWARIWPLQTLIRAMGAYFVRRNSRDPLYRKVLERYVGMATEAGVTQAVFPEGGLSRDGRLRPPRLGILDYMVRGFDPSGGRDIIFVPVGINYDRTFEDRTMIAREDPTFEHPGALGAAVRTVRFLGRNLRLMATNRWHRFGYACVNFGSPISLREYLGRHAFDFRRLPREEHSKRLEELAGELMRAVARVIPALPVPLVATVFVREPERAWSELELKAAVLGIVRELSDRGAHVYVPRGDQDYAITVGLRMLTLRRLVDAADGLYRARTEELPLLSYYASSIAHLFTRPPGRPA